MTWPASDVGTTNSDAGTDSPATARSDLLDLMQKFNQLRNHVTSLMQTVLNVGAYTPSLAIAFSSTPSIDASLSNVVEFGTLTANVTSMTITNPQPGRTINIRVVQDATGGRTVAMPTGAQVSGTPNSAANKVSWLTMIYATNAGGSARWEGSWMLLP
jgi:hypothetical protein